MPACRPFVSWECSTDDAADPARAKASRPHQAPLPRCSALIGFTAIEILLVVMIIVILMSLLFPVVNMIRQSSRKTQANALISTLHMAVNLYIQEDSQHRYPPASPDDFMRLDAQPGGALVLNMVFAEGVSAGIQKLVDDPATSGLKVLIDPWQRPYRYRVDSNMDGKADQPAPLTDWNGKMVEPYAYVWSLGIPRLSTMGTWQADPDAAPTAAKNWLYVKTTP